MANFAIIGAAGFVAPRHMKAISNTGNKLVAVVDPSDSLGILDQYGYDVECYRNMDDFCAAMVDMPEKITHVSVCSPNFLHTSHIIASFNRDAEVICEKPIVINVEDLKQLRDAEDKYGRKVNVILQLRLHPTIQGLKRRFAEDSIDNVRLEYVTPRGSWYRSSWKGRAEESGGLAMNIGIHFFDMLIWVFGAVKSSRLDYSSPKRMMGILELERTTVEWLLSVDPKDIKEDSGEATRSLQVNGETINFSSGFTGLHTTAYEEILAGRGFGIDDAEPSVKLVSEINSMAGY